MIEGCTCKRLRYGKAAERLGKHRGGCPRRIDDYYRSVVKPLIDQLNALVDSLPPRDDEDADRRRLIAFHRGMGELQRKYKDDGKP